MAKRNPYITRLHSGYIFPEITKKRKQYQEKHPEAKLISLGIGDTTQPIPKCITDGMAAEAQKLSTPEGYHGYGPEQGQPALREAIAAKLYHHKISPDDIFISDGSKCDIGRLQILFGSDATMAVQDPSYPVYVDTSVMVGQTGNYSPAAKYYQGITYLPCLPSNGFFPDLDAAPRTDLLYFCAPNNPTGAVATHKQLEELVKFCKKNGTILIYDAAYACFIRDPALPKSIYEIAGAEEVAIELGSFSKMVGFTGVRLAWSVVPKSLRFEAGELVHTDWSRMHTTFFNGASNIAQAGGLAALSDEGLKAMEHLVDYYLENAKLLRGFFVKHGFNVQGGDQAPYLWVEFPGKSSWEAFDWLLDQAHVIATPGIGFGPAGEGFIRFSTFTPRSLIEIAIERLGKMIT